MLHESGTGGAPKYGVVAQMPVVGAIGNPLAENTNDTRAEPDYTEVGYYRAKLGSGTTVELAASTKAGLLQYTFPKTTEPLNIWVDVSHVLSSYRGQGLGQHYLGGNISVFDDKDKAGYLYYTGSGKYDNVSRDKVMLAAGIKKKTDQYIGMEQSWSMDRLLLRPL